MRSLHSSWKIGTTLPLLFGAMTALVIGSLTVPLVDDVQKLRQSGTVVAVTAAGGEVFTALQNTRTQRGPTRVALDTKDPASDAFLTMIASARAKADPALTHVIEMCRSIDCTGGKAEIVAGLPTSIERLSVLRKEADAALRVPLERRRQAPARPRRTFPRPVVERLRP